MTDLLTTQEVAQLAGVTRATVRTYIYRREMPAPDAHVGRTPVWKPETITEWLEERKRAARAAGEKTKRRTRSTDASRSRPRRCLVCGVVVGYINHISWDRVEFSRTEACADVILTEYRCKEHAEDT